MAPSPDGTDLIPDGTDRSPVVDAAWTLAASGVLHVVAALVFAAVARHVARRESRPESRLAVVAFATWWTLAAVYSGLLGAQYLLVYAGVRDLALFVTFRVVTLAVLLAAFWGLVFYLVYLWRGRRADARALAVFYGLAFPFLVFAIVVSEPVDVLVAPWHTGLVAGRAFALDLTRFAVAALAVPPLLATLAYARLYSRVATSEQRWRVALISTSLFVWLGAMVLARMSDASFLQFLARPLLGMTAAVAVLAALLPPAWVRRRWRTHPAALARTR